MSLMVRLAVQIGNAPAHPVMPDRSGAVGITITAIGVAMAVVGLVRMARARRSRVQAMRVVGEVVDNIPFSSRWGRISWVPLVEFTVGDGVLRVEVPPLRSRRGYRLGAAVDILSDALDSRLVYPVNPSFPLSGWFIGGVSIVVAYLAISA